MSSTVTLAQTPAADTSSYTAVDYAQPGDSVVFTLLPSDACGVVIASLTVDLLVVCDSVTVVNAAVPDAGTGMYSHSQTFTDEGICTVTMSATVGITYTTLATGTLYIAPTSVLVGSEYVHVSADYTTVSGIPVAMEAYEITLSLADLSGSVIQHNLSPLMGWDGGLGAVSWNADTYSYTLSGSICDGYQAAASFAASVNGVAVFSQAVSYPTVVSEA
ncbi:hypothetical protein KIPB_014999, partial [Kipferlia bialata]|eukprot:g14999.t1